MPHDHTHEHLTLTAADGYQLGATRYKAHGSARGHLIIAGATGVPQRFYRRFAEYASARGFTALTLDYRGIGQSAPATLKGFPASFLDWARMDLEAAVLSVMDPATPLFLVGHSFGAQALGLIASHARIAGCCSFGVGAGWDGWMAPVERLKVHLLWHAVLPFLVAWKGYLPLGMLRMGEDLPLGVYRQWKYWCRFQHYFFDDPQLPALRDLYADVRTPVLAVTALDDRWATPRSRDAFLLAFRSARIERLEINPADFGGTLGHMGYFREQAQPLWKQALDWLSLTPGRNVAAPQATTSHGR